MITISEKYLLQTPDIGGGFNLIEEVVKKRKGTGEEYKDLKLIGYNMTIDRAIARVAELECSRDDYSDVIGYLKAVEAKVDEAAKEIINNLK